MKDVSKYELKFETRPDYLYAKVTCESMSLELAQLYIREVADKCRDTGVQRVIIDRECPNTLSNTMSFLAMSNLSELAPDGLRMGIVDVHDENRRHLDFGIRSIEKDDVDVRIFATVVDAESWLASESA